MGSWEYFSFQGNGEFHPANMRFRFYYVFFVMLDVFNVPYRFMSKMNSKGLNRIFRCEASLRINGVLFFQDFDREPIL